MCARRAKRLDSQRIVEAEKRARDEQAAQEQARRIEADRLEQAKADYKHARRHYRGLQANNAGK